MTVADLIKMLATMQPDLPVYVEAPVTAQDFEAMLRRVRNICDGDEVLLTTCTAAKAVHGNRTVHGPDIPHVLIRAEAP